jgi:hypothetical protein
MHTLCERARRRRHAPMGSQFGRDEPVSVLSRAFGVQPATPTRCGFNAIL